MPALLPGILELSRRARYLSFHAFLLDEYQRRRMPADPGSLSLFVRRREWELGLAVQRCPAACGSSPVGARKLGAFAGQSGPFPRGESVESNLGGYGLYYRTPMAEVGVVARAGTMLGDQPISIDVLRNTDRAKRLAEEFRSSVGHTRYYQRAMWTNDSLPAKLIDEYAEVACLCRLRDRVSEQQAVHEALFGSDPADEADGSDHLSAEDAPLVQRRRSVAHYLALVAGDPMVPWSHTAYREALWSPPPPRSEAHAAVAGQWAGLVAKDVWQDALCSVWSQFCRDGLAYTRKQGHDLTPGELRQIVSDMVTGPPALAADHPTADVAEALLTGALGLPDEDGNEVVVADASLEDLRWRNVRLDSATSGLVLLLELHRRTAGRTDPGWMQAAGMRSAWQPSLRKVLADLDAHLERGPTVAETLWWLVSHFVVPVHERIAYSKLPEFTFRFRWEEGLLRFYDKGMGRFPLAAIRDAPLAWLTWDLGLWTGDEPEQTGLTARGAAFVDEVLA
ncbi:hypothetical protein JD81_04467 [Micromonospora sagamiensis]|uniref:Uncharacterized protein n=2 Tax=Micromonospora sagamiensis TaxID=47875 RepID=A0A562WL51_9ACTN|nr:hypothetical protein JD81_04467 [Micromonospora sagamiensis]